MASVAMRIRSRIGSTPCPPVRAAGGIHTAGSVTAWAA